MLFKNLGPKHTEKSFEKIIIYVHVLLSNIMIMLWWNMQALWAWDGHNVVKSY